MSEQHSGRKAPYASFLKFLEMLDWFQRDGIPDRVTHSNVGDFSAEVRSHLVQALKFLSLIDESGVPTDSFRDLLALEPVGRGELFQRIILASYKCPLEGVDLATVQRSGLLESFNVCYATAKDTTRKCVRFFAYAAIAGKLELSTDVRQFADGNRDNGGTAALTKKLFVQKLPDNDARSGKEDATTDQLEAGSSRGSNDRSEARETDADEARKSQRYDALIDLFDAELMTEQELRAGVVMLKFARRCAEVSASG